MLSRISRKLSTLLLGALLTAAPLFAQSTTGSFQGTVKDEQQAVVPGAAVTVRNVDTNVGRAVVTDSRGPLPSAQPAPPGTYEVTFELGRLRRLRPLRDHAGPQPGRRDRGDGSKRQAQAETITVAGRRAAPQHDQRRGRRALRQQRSGAWPTCP